jgi:Ca2+-binding RTX toxin-like protein
VIGLFIEEKIARGSNAIDGGDGDDYLQGGGVTSTIRGGAGNDTIRITSGTVTRVDAGPGDDTITAVILRGHATISCGAGNDTVMVSRFAGNRRNVRLASDCEHKKKQ